MGALRPRSPRVRGPGDEVDTYGKLTGAFPITTPFPPLPPTYFAHLLRSVGVVAAAALPLLLLAVVGGRSRNRGGEAPGRWRRRRQAAGGEGTGRRG